MPADRGVCKERALLIIDARSLHVVKAQGEFQALKQTASQLSRSMRRIRASTVPAGAAWAKSVAWPVQSTCSGTGGYSEKLSSLSRKNGFLFRECTLAAFNRNKKPFRCRQGQKGPRCRCSRARPAPGAAPWATRWSACGALQPCRPQAPSHPRTTYALFRPFGPEAHRHRTR